MLLLLLLNNFLFKSERSDVNFVVDWINKTHFRHILKRCLTNSVSHTFCVLCLNLSPYQTAHAQRQRASVIATKAKVQENFLQPPFRCVRWHKMAPGTKLEISPKSVDILMALNSSVCPSNTSAHFRIVTYVCALRKCVIRELCDKIKTIQFRCVFNN